MRFNPPPGWPTPPAGWTPPADWTPDASWPAPPPGWELFVHDDEPAAIADDAAAHAPQVEVRALPADTAAQTPAAPAGTEVLLARIASLEAALVAAGGDGAAAEAVELSDQRVLQDVGIYRYHHPLENAAAYKDRLRELEGQVDTAIKSGRAILAAEMFTFSGSLAKGRKLVGDLSKLMLRAYNAEADNCVRSLRSGNVHTAKKRLESAMAAIEKLGAIMEMRISPEYHALRIAEVELTADFQMKVQEEREKARGERELLREQRRAEADSPPRRNGWRRSAATTGLCWSHSGLRVTRLRRTSWPAAWLTSIMPSLRTTIASRTSAPAMCMSSPTSAPSGQVS